MENSSIPNCDLLRDMLKHVNGGDVSGAGLIELSTLLTSLACLLVSLILNTYIVSNIAFRKKFKVFYFTIFILLLFVQTLYLGLVSFNLFISTLPECLPSSSLIDQMARAATPVSRSCLGIFACIVGALTIERFISSTSASPVIRCCTNLLAVVTAVSGPVLVVAFFLITTNGEEEQIQQEFWFGAEVCVYIICPLLALTVFGTVNCCKVSMTSRLLPSYQIQAIKLNIGVTISTNVAMFIFLVQESLHLWQSQLQVKPLEETILVKDDLESAIISLGLAHNVCSILLCLIITMISFLYCIICCTCCSPCCCPAINQLEQVSYTPVMMEIR